MSDFEDVIIIGAGQSGLAVGYELQRAGISFHLVDAHADVGGSWQDYWDSLRVFSPAKYSQLPGMNFPGDPAHYPGRRDVVRYLRDYAAHFEMPFTGDFRVKSVTRHDGLFCVEDAQGRTRHGRALIVAAGPFNKPYVPALPAQDVYTGCVMHSYQYRRKEPFAGQRIVVVGSRNSAVQIGCELATVADVTLAVRHEIKWLPKYILGKSIFFWIHDTGFDMIPLGYFFDLKDTVRVIDDGTYRRAIEAGQPNTRSMFTAFTPDGVQWADGEREGVDTVLFATGFRPDNVPFLRSLGALDDDNRPLERGGISTVVDGLYYMGVFGQRTPASATLRGVGADAEYIAGRLQDDLRG